MQNIKACLISDSKQSCCRRVRISESLPHGSLGTPDARHDIIHLPVLRTLHRSSLLPGPRKSSMDPQRGNVGSSSSPFVQVSLPV